MDFMLLAARFLAEIQTILSTFLGITQEAPMGDSFCDIINGT